MADFRRNFVHNCIVHPFCGLLWAFADLFLSGSRKTKLVEFGLNLHDRH